MRDPNKIDVPSDRVAIADLYRCEAFSVEVKRVAGLAHITDPGEHGAIAERLQGFRHFPGDGIRVAAIQDE